MHIIFI